MGFIRETLQLIHQKPTSKNYISANYGLKFRNKTLYELYSFLKENGLIVQEEKIH